MRISYAVFCLKKNKTKHAYTDTTDSYPLIKVLCLLSYYFCFKDTTNTEIYTYCHTLSLHDALPILLRQLLLARDGAGVEELCECLRITHNAVRQHLTTLIVRGLVERVQPRATGGRPQARYVLTAEGRELFPRNYGAIAAALISQLHARMGEAEVGAMLQELGATVAATQAPLQGENGEALTRALAQRPDEVGRAH